MSVVRAHGVGRNQQISTGQKRDERESAKSSVDGRDHKERSALTQDEPNENEAR